jgi:hypothetical protein
MRDAPIQGRPLQQAIVTGDQGPIVAAETAAPLGLPYHRIAAHFLGTAMEFTH